MTPSQALSQAEELQRQWAEAGREFVRLGEAFSEALAQLSAALAIEKAKED